VQDHWPAVYSGCRGCQPSAGAYSFAQAAKTPNALSEIIVATISTIIGA
jgi:hypothetical protein